MSGRERLIVVGGGGFAREVICWARDCEAQGTLPPLYGFLDDRADIELPAYGLPKLGTVTGYSPRAEDRFLLAVGAPSTRRRLAEVLTERNAEFATLIHPTAIVAQTAEVGEGSILCPHSLLAADACIGRFVIINCFSSAGHDSRVGAFSTLSSHVDVTGYATLGEETMLGSHAAILPGVKIADRATVGAGATVYRSVPAGATVYAPPAKRLP